MIFGTDLNLKKHLSRIDWQLLLFLVLFLNVKLAVKIAAIVIIYLLRFNLRFNLSLKGSRLPLFYLLILFIPFIDLFFNRQYTNINYLLVFITGIAFWLLCLLAIHQVKLAVENNDAGIIHRTILVFFIINIAFSLGNIALVIWHSGAINPYRYQGQYQKYFINTGDYIKGISFDTSTTNAAINAFGVIYFLIRKNPLMTLVCMTILLLTGSNFVNIALIVMLLLLFIFKSDRNQKSIIAICFALLVVFMVKISPQNDGYAEKILAAFIKAPEKNNLTKPVPVRCSNIPDTESLHQKVAMRYVDSAKKEWIKRNSSKKSKALPQTGFGRIIIPPDDIDSKPFQHIDDTTADKAVLLKFISDHKNALSLSAQPVFKPGLPGKVLTLKQTFTYLKNNPSKLLTGSGIGRFSSKLAFRATGFGFAGGFPVSHTYINTDFLTNHLDVYLYFFSKSAGLHSLTNSPNSVYDQLLTEYGLLGLLAFTIFYLGFFAKHAKALTYGVPLLGLMLMVFFSDYWFEQLSVIILFELLLLLNIKETTPKAQLNYGS